MGRRVHKSYTVQGVAALLKRHGWSCQVPARRAIERGGGGWLAGWLAEGDLARRGRTVAVLDACILFEDEAGFSMTPPHCPHLVSAAAILPSSGAGGVPAVVSRWPPCSATGSDSPPG
ncbi:winged helix-turn-helix domain-containing protein [Streptomyces griseorubiginosus]|uniref:winged helix-turn-helix domain-containing protein n=1 Tax=Streptomyces griseorubiginosus TaxID=67304 RepID=UPI00367D32A4